MNPRYFYITPYGLCEPFYDDCTFLGWRHNMHKNEFGRFKVLYSFDVRDAVVDDIVMCSFFDIEIVRQKESSVHEMRPFTSHEQRIL